MSKEVLNNLMGGLESVEEGDSTRRSPREGVFASDTSPVVATAGLSVGTTINTVVDD